jgi:hypothetical protein
LAWWLWLALMPALAQAGTVGGTVVDPAGRPVAGVTIRLSGGLPGTVTDAQGRYAVAGVAEGTAATVTPSGAGGVFTPTSRQVVVSDGGATADFVAGAALGVGESLAVGGFSVAPLTTVMNYATPLLKVRLAASGGDATITALKIRNLSTANPASVTPSIAVGSAVLPSSASYNPGTADWTINLTTPYVLRSGAAIYWTLRGACNAAGESMGFSVANSLAVGTSASVTGRFPLSSGVTTVQAGVNVSGYSVAPATAVLGATTAMLKVYFQAWGADATLRGLVLRNLGNADPALTTPSIAVGASVLPSSASYDAGTACWTVTLTTPYLLRATRGIYWTIRLATTVPGSTLRVSVPDLAAILSDGPVAGAPPILSGATNVGADINVSGFNVAPATADVNVVTNLLKVRLEATVDATITGLRLRDLGAGDPRLATVSLAVGANALPATASYDVLTATWTLTLATPYVLRAGTSIYWTVRSALAASGTMRVSVPDRAAVVTNNTVGGALPLVSGATTVNAPGNTIWARQMGGDGEDFGGAVAVAPDGGVYHGYTRAVPLPGGGTALRAELSKLRPDGVDAWFRSPALPTATTNTYAGPLSLDPQGNVLFAVLVGRVGAPTEKDLVLVKYTPEGGLTWQSQLPGQGASEVRDTATNTAGTTFLVGSCTGGYGVASGGQDVLLAACTANGNWVASTMFGSAADDYGYGVTTAGADTVFVVGETRGNLAGPSNGGPDYFIARFRSTLARDWVRQYGTALKEDALSVAVYPQGDIAVCGRAQIVYGNDPNPADIGFLARHTDDGDPVWTRQISLSTGGLAHCVGVDAAGNASVLGRVGVSGNVDCWLTRFDGAGNRLWLRQFGGPGHDWPWDLAVDAWGSSFVAGETEGSTYAPSPGMRDACLVRFGP